VHCVANPTISSILINFVFDLHLFFITTPRRDSDAAAAVSDPHHRWLLWLRDALLLPSGLLQPARRRLDRDRFGSCRLPPHALCSALIGSVLLYTGPNRLSLLHRLDGFHSARSRGDMRSPQSYHASGGGCWRPWDTCRHQNCPKPGGGNRSRGDTQNLRSCPTRPQSYHEPGGGNRSRGDTWRPRSCPTSGGGCCPEPVYYWLFQVISS
jgi:hypothetical protein